MNPENRKTNPLTPGIDADKFSAFVEQHLRMGDVKSAVFWAEKLLALQTHQNGGRPMYFQVANYFRVLYIASEWQMILSYIQHRDLQYRHIVFAFYYVSALYHLEKYQEITLLPLGHLQKWEDVPTLYPDPTLKVFVQRNVEFTFEDTKYLDEMMVAEQFESRILFLLSQTYFQLENHKAASACLLKSIELNPMSCESVCFALKSHLLSVKKMKEVLQNSQVEDQKMLDVVYMMLDFHDVERDEDDKGNEQLEKCLSSDLSIRTAKAYRFYALGQINAAYQIADEIVNKSGYFDDCLLIYIGCLVELKKTVELYELCHKLVTLTPEKETTWYAIGCYYYAAGQHQLAKRYFYKCTAVNPNFGYGWLAYGHALSSDREHDPAMSCYLRASQLLANFAEPLLYIGLEYGHSNSLKQASDSISDALGFCTKPNPVILHEQGTVFLVASQYEYACESFFKALIAITRIKTNNPLQDLAKLLNAVVDEYWVNLYFNLGMTLFELKKPCCAIACFRKVLEMGIERDRAYMMIAFCYCRAGRPKLAIPVFQKSLAINPNETTAKIAYDKAVSMAAHLSFSSESMTIDDLMQEDFVDHKQPTDDRPNLGRHLLNTPLLQSYKFTCERTFRILRGTDSQKSPKSSDEVPEKQSAARLTRFKSEDEYVQLKYPGSELLDRPRTAPATMEAIEEHMQTDEDTQATSEQDMSSEEPQQEQDDLFAQPRVLDFNSTTESELIEAASSQAKKLNISVTPMVKIEDPHELMTEWFMEDIRRDMLMMPDEDLETLRAPIIPRKRAEEPAARHSDFSFLRTPINPGLRTRRQRQT